MFSTPDSSFLAKQSLDILKKIGEGSFSKVYLAKCGETVDNRIIIVATKVINKNRVSMKFVEKFLPRELDVLLKLKHPFIIKIYSIHQYGYKIYINMEYAGNGDMFTYLRKNTLNEDQIRSWLVQILWAFKYMHGVGVVHRDLKCENILLTDNYNVRVADFGFARFVSRGRNPGVDTICGTLMYSSPELLSGTRPYNPVATDVWAIGVVLFMMSNNVAPFRDKKKEEIYKKQVAKDYSFRKVLNRSASLKELTAIFLEPNLLRRVRIINALQHIWIKKGRTKAFLNVDQSSDSAQTENQLLNVPIITLNTLNLSTFHYKKTQQENSISTFNNAFVEIEEHDAIDIIKLPIIK